VVGHTWVQGEVSIWYMAGVPVGTPILHYLAHEGHKAKTTEVGVPSPQAS
jgi:hypothetical protein